MDRMFAPWRRAFVEGAVEQKIPSPTGCIFCDFPLPLGVHPEAEDLGQKSNTAQTRRSWDRARLVVTVREQAFVILNKFPYANGHTLIVPRPHGGRVDDLEPEAFSALHALLHECVRAVDAVYKPHAMNVGMNIGKAAGAGIAEHAHYHIVPRWDGDNNFMPVLNDVRVISEGIDDTYERLAKVLRRPEDDA